MWQPLFGFMPSIIQASFMKYTAGAVKRSLTKNDEDTLAAFKVKKYDRTYQLLKRELLLLLFELITASAFNQKLEYIPSELYGTDIFGMLTHFLGN